MQTYSVIVHEETEDDGGGYWAEVEELPGCYASGETLDALEHDVRAAIEQHVVALVELGKAVPKSRITNGHLRRWQIAVA